MKIRALTFGLFRVIAGTASALMTAYGVYLFDGAYFSRDMLVMILFCALPAMSFPVFLLSFRWLRWSVAMHWILAIGYLGVYSMLDWRTCAEREDCQGVISVVLQTLTARPVESAFAIAAFNLVMLLLNCFVGGKEKKQFLRSSPTN